MPLIQIGLNLASLRVPKDDPDLPNPNVKDYTVRELDMVAEKATDDTIQKLKTKLENGDASPAVYNRHFIVNDIVYYISNPTDNPTARLYVPKQLRLDVLTQYHDDLVILESTRHLQTSKQNITGQHYAKRYINM